MNRSAMREIAFKFLYGAEIQKDLDASQIDDFFANYEITDENAKKYVSDIVTGINENKDEIIKLIEQNLKADWKIERISKVSLALLKLAILEIKYQNLPYKAIINEVVELSKKYGEDNSHVFVNGILASIVNE
ncbi:MAG: transcription antitermination factor NusB [Clostridia bacterium]|nr:transcription antitermination factor NusB [Clostridia bacterium]